MDKIKYLCHSLELTGAQDEVLIVTKKGVKDIKEAKEILEKITKERHTEEKFNNEKFILLEVIEEFIFKKGGAHTNGEIKEDKKNNNG